MSADLPLSPDDVAEIVAILDSSQYERLELKTPRFALKLARAGAGGWTQEWDHGSTPAAIPAAVAFVAAKVAEEADDGTTPVYPPLPGTFYRAPQPGAAPFIKEGDAVTPDTVVGIIETMKLMNPVHAGVAGSVAAILVPDGTLIDGATVLMRVVPDRG